MGKAITVEIYNILMSSRYFCLVIHCWARPGLPGQPERDMDPKKGTVD